MNFNRMRHCALTGVVMALMGATACQSELRGALNGLVDEMEAGAQEMVVVYRAEVERLEAEQDRQREILRQVATWEETVDDSRPCGRGLIGRQGLADDVYKSFNVAHSTCQNLARHLSSMRESVETVTGIDFEARREELAELTEAELTGVAPRMRANTERFTKESAERLVADNQAAHAGFVEKIEGIFLR